MTGTAPAHQIEIIPARPTACDEVSVRISGTWSNTCVPTNARTRFYPGTFGPGGNYDIQLVAPDPGACALVLTPFTVTVRLGRIGHMAGGINSYLVTVEDAQATFDVGPCDTGGRPILVDRWWWTVFSEAIGGGYYATRNTRATDISTATWQGTPVSGPGRYRVEVFIPRQPGTGSLPRTENAQYTIYPGGPAVTARISQRVTTSQWVDLGTYHFDGPYRIVLTDRTGEPGLTRSVVANAVRLTKQ
jgi:hypothetical protein